MFWCPELVEQARGLGVLLVPGVFSPTEVHQAIRFGCRVVKLFPAANLEPGYWSRLQAPLGPLPFVIAAEGNSGDLPPDQNRFSDGISNPLIRKIRNFEKWGPLRT